MTTRYTSSDDHAQRFYAALERHEQAAEATSAGREFLNANFQVSHTGGGCTAWERMVDDTGWYIWITDLSGTDTILHDDVDCWLVGLHGPDGQFHDCLEAKTAPQAILIADCLHAARIAGDEASLPKLNNA